jgi:serine/threonine protein kinase
VTERLPPDPEQTAPRELTQTRSLPGSDADSTRPDANSEPDGEPILPRIPGYAISRQIAKGGMGRVLAGTELALDREVAIKTLLPGARADRFHSESKITARLPHPSIPPIYALGTLDDGSPFLAMKFVRGRTLAAELKARASPTDDVTRFLQVFEQICQAVGFAHSQGVVHRDLKPANVMLGAFGEVQVMDWGLAKDARKAELPEGAPAPMPFDEGDTSTELTRAGTVLGTPSYMAPEQARGEVVDARADVFALGGILCNVLTGRPVHEGRSVSETVQNAAAGRLSDAIARLDACGADAELVGIAKRCLAPKRDDRPADGQAVAELVAGYRRGVEVRLHHAETERAAIQVREAEQAKRRRLFVRLAGAVALVLVMGIAGTSIGLVQAREAAAAEAIAKNDAVGQKNKADEERKKAEGRLGVLRAAINTFTNELPSIGEHLPLSDALRRELLELSRKLVSSIHLEGDRNDTYDFGIHAIGVRESQEALTRGDTQGARAKMEAARDGFQKILESNPESYDRARNNLAMAITEIGKLDAADHNFAAAEAHFQKALALRQDVVANPHGDIASSELEQAIVSTLMVRGEMELGQKHLETAESRFREAMALLEKLLAAERNSVAYEGIRLNWVTARKSPSRGTI